MEGFFPLKKEKSWDLSDITFERFHGGPEWLSRRLSEKLVSEQDPGKFSRAPYLQLQGYYNSIGDEVEANEIHYKGHCAFRRNAWSTREDGRAQWSLGKKITDTILMFSIGWGHKTGRIFLWIFLFLVIGTLIFSWNEGALAVNYQSVSRESVQEFVIDIPLPRGISDGYFWPDLLYGFAYSLALFIPVINVGYAYWFIPTHGLAQIYAGIHAILGWILVGLLLVSWAGIFNRE